MDRTILHCDCNGFYASVEGVRDPALRRVPMAVCGDPEHRHGVILAKNELAKQRGVRTAETVFQARQKCPGLVLVPPHRELYEEYSRRVNAIYARYTDMVEPFGIDESWLDVTGSRRLFGGGQAIADALRRTVREETGLTISVGVSFNKIFAKLGSDYKKPDATTLISPENWQEIVWPLPVGAMLFVGRSAQRTLAQYGVETIGQLAACRPEMIEKLLGKLGRQLHEYANGLDRSPVRPQAEREPVKSVGNGTTFPHDLTRWEEVRAGLAALSDSVAMRLRRQGLYCSGVQVTIKDSSFRSISRQKRLESPTRLMKDIQRAAMELTRSAWRAPTPIRMLTVTALHITESAESFEQLDLLGAGRAVSDARQEKLESAVRAIRDKFGDGSITFGSGEPPGAKGN